MYTSYDFKDLVCHNGFIYPSQASAQGLSQDFETGCLKFADFVKCLGVQIFKGVTIYSYFNHKRINSSK